MSEENIQQMVKKSILKIITCGCAAAVVILTSIQVIQLNGVNSPWNNVLDSIVARATTTTKWFDEEKEQQLEDADDIQIQSIINRLTDKKSIIPYYMYDDPQIEQVEMKKHAQTRTCWHTWSYFIAENEIINALKTHHWRTNNNNNNNNTMNDDAKLFIIPFSTSAALLNEGNETKYNVQKAFQTLYDTSIFQSTLGHKHILFTLAIPSFATWWRHLLYPIEYTGLTNEYQNLINVTIVNDLDFEAIFNYQKTLPKEYQYLVNRTYPITRYSFSMNLQSYSTMEVRKASINKFYNSSIHINYHTRNNTYTNNSTTLRRSPLTAQIPKLRNPTVPRKQKIISESCKQELTYLRTKYGKKKNTTNTKNSNNDNSTKKWRNNNNANNYNTNADINMNMNINNNNNNNNINVNSIGYEIPKDIWEERFIDSQFCLSVRGDSPHSRSFLRAIKVGCIPVIIGQIPYFAPIFKHLIPIENYSIIIDDEDEFIKNPTKELLKLHTIPKDIIISKIKWLAFAQRLFFLDHPKSLFIEAFLTEANISSTIDLHQYKIS